MLLRDKVLAKLFYTNPCEGHLTLDALSMHQYRQLNDLPNSILLSYISTAFDEILEELKSELHKELKIEIYRRIYGIEPKQLLSKD